jgi:hypothetical protein
MTETAHIRDAIAQLWRNPPAVQNARTEGGRFGSLIAACNALNPHLDDKTGHIPLENALRAIGAPWMSIANFKPLPPSPEEAAQRLAAALVAKRGRRIHLCPLDEADTLPQWKFGPNRIARLAPNDLDMIISPARLLRHNGHWFFDSRRFAQFQWLIVEEEVDLDCRPLVRALPMLGVIAGDIDGRILPHAGKMPGAVEAALFALLLRPWEDVIEHAEFDWRPFRIPWVYTVDDDIFASPAAPPDPTTLRWAPDALTSADGEVIEIERPDVWHLDAAKVREWPDLDDAVWQQLVSARQSDLLTRPVAHFVVRAFLAEGIDEFLAHITAIEAALALPRDHIRPPSGKKRPPNQKDSLGQPTESRPPLSDGKDPGATARLSMRVSKLLGLEPSDPSFRQLYTARSKFLHGATMDYIPENERLAARRFTRKIINALIQRSVDDSPVVRTAFLESLCP